MHFDGERRGNFGFPVKFFVVMSLARSLHQYPKLFHEYFLAKSHFQKLMMTL